MPRPAGIRLLTWLVVGLSCWLLLRPAEAAAWLDAAADQRRAVPGAQIHSQDSLKNIEAVQTRDLVWPRDEFTDECAWRTVVAVFVTHPAESDMSLSPVSLPTVKEPPGGRKVARGIISGGFSSQGMRMPAEWISKYLEMSCEKLRKTIVKPRMTLNGHLAPTTDD